MQSHLSRFAVASKNASKFPSFHANVGELYALIASTRDFDDGGVGGRWSVGLALAPMVQEFSELMPRARGLWWDEAPARARG